MEHVVQLHIERLPEGLYLATSDEMQKIADDAANMDATNAAEWEKQRNAILTDLRDLRDGIDKDLAKCNEALAKKDLRSMERGQQQNMKEELEREKAVVDGAIARVEEVGADASQEDRSRVRIAAENTRDEVKTWWAKRKEVQDKHTDADYDNDGH